MARRESRTHVRIWADRDFTSLSASAQRVYWTVYSQPNINLCGTIALTVGRWAKLASDTTVEDIWTALKELEAAGYVIIDTETEELLVRSFVRWDGGWFSSKTRGVAIAQRDQVLSSRIHDALEEEFERAEKDRLAREAGPDTKPQENGVSTETEIGVNGGDANTPRAHAHAISNLPSPSPISNHQSPSPSELDKLVDLGCSAITLKKLEMREAAKGQLTHRNEWIQQVGPKDRREFASSVRRLVEADPSLTPTQVAERILL